jgi:hypothetical protein
MLKQGVICFALLLSANVRAAEGTRFFVSPQGNDRWSGLKDDPDLAKSDGPFATLERARDAVREIKRAKGPLTAGIEIEVRGGRYELTRPLALTAEDSGTPEAPVVYRARAGETASLSGGRRVTAWTAVSDPAVLARLDPVARGKLYQADLRAQGVTEYGDLGLDAAAGIQLWLARVEGQGEYTMGSAAASAGKKVSPRLELFFNDAPMPLSRYPNEGSIAITEVFGATPIDVRGVKGCAEGVFAYDGDRPSRWAGEKDAWVCGSWFRDWAEQAHKVQSIDTEKRTIAVKPPYHGYGYRKGQWFFGLNLLCEIDAPGEWMIDREAGVLYFWPPSDLGAANVEVSLAPGLVTLNDAAHVTLRGLLFEAARGTGVTVSNSVQCRIAGCTFRNLSNHGVTVFGGKENSVVGCDLYGLGGGGIYLVGGDRPTLTPAGHTAENNHIHHYARWDRMYRPGVMVSGVGNRVAHNLIHDAPHSAILFGGNDHVIEFNEIHSVCYDSNDCGAIYSGRSWTLRGHVIRYNYLHHLYGRPGGPCRGIYLDDLFSSATLYGNLFYQVTWAVFLGGGRDNLVENNVFVDCPQAVQVDARALGWCGPHADRRIKEAQENGTIAGIRYREPPFSTRYPQLPGLLEDEPKKPKGNVVRRNIFWAGPGEDIRRVMHGAVPASWWNAIDAQSRPYVKLENNLNDVDPLFADAGNGNYQLSDASPAWATGFQRIPVEKIGLCRNASRASWPVTHTPRPLPQPPRTLSR